MLKDYIKTNPSSKRKEIFKANIIFKDFLHYRIAAE